MNVARSLVPRACSRVQIAFRVSLKTTLLGYFAAAFAFAATATNAQNLRVAPVFPWTSAFSLDLNILVPEGRMLPATQFPSYQACDAGQRSSAAQAILEGDGPQWALHHESVDLPVLRHDYRQHKRRVSFIGIHSYKNGLQWSDYRGRG